MKEQATKQFILFGASGDLARQKLYPALFHLFDPAVVMRRVGFSRTEMTNAEFREMIRGSILVAQPTADAARLELFLLSWEYVFGSYDAKGIGQLVAVGVSGKSYFYLSIPSGLDLIRGIVGGLAEHRLISKESTIVLEKPFGFDLASARAVNRVVRKHFDETRIFRIDHYLAKDLVQDMLALRFANPIFEPIWNETYIEKVEIEIKEEEGIRYRGQYYDRSGLIRDMIQNHALQLLAFAVMDAPRDLSATSIHKEKITVFRKIRLFDEDVRKSVSLGQYRGYTDEPYVAKGSLTETFASLQVRIDRPGWRHVPITIMSGKRLDRKSTDITVTFKKNSKSMWNNMGCDIASNIVKINVQPHNDIRLQLNSEYSTSDKCAYPTELRFGFKDNKFILKESYENALRDLFADDQSIFINSKEIELSWQFIDGILEKIAPLRKKMMRVY